MTLLLTFLGVSLVVFALLWATAAVLQPYLYSEVAERMPLRAAIGGVAIGAFLTFWTYANTRAEYLDKYGTLFEFTSTGTREISEFEAVRRLNRKGADGQWAEETVAFKRLPGRSGEFAEGGDPARKFLTNTASYMTIALLVPEGEGKARFEAELDRGGTAYRSSTEKVFRERGGRRYIETVAPGVVHAPSRWAMIAAILLNVLHFALWFAVFWPVMRFGSEAALGGAAVFGLVTMLMVMPLLFVANRTPPVAVSWPA